MSEANTASPSAGQLLRLPQIIGNPKAKPPVPAIFPVSRSTWFAGVKSGRYPKPVKISKNLVAWRAEDIQALLDNPAPANPTTDE